MDTLRLAYLVSHPIQYQAPLLRRIAAEPGISLKVFFCSDVSMRKHNDPGFGRPIEWGVPLVDGYEHEFLPAYDDASNLSLWRPINHGLSRRLKDGRFDVLWVHGYARWFHVAAMANAKRLGIKVLLRDEGTRTSAQRGPAKLALKKMFFAALRQVCDGTLAIGSQNREYWRDYGFAEDRIFPMPYAVDNAFFQARAAEAAKRREAFRAELGLEPGRPVILYASKMSARKFPDTLFEAWYRLHDDARARRPYLLFVGDGEKTALLKAEARALRADSVRFLGFRNQPELPAFYDLSDVFVLASANEPWGLVVNEAMNAGRPVIASPEVGSAGDLVREGENGFVVPPGDARALQDALRKVLEDPKTADRMGRRSLQIIDDWDFERDVAGLRRALAALCPGKFAA